MRTSFACCLCRAAAVALVAALGVNAGEWPRFRGPTGQGISAETGVFRCLDAAGGKVLWRNRVRGEYYASPVWANGRIYAVNQKGETTVLEAGPTFKVVASNALGEKCFASPAVAHGAIFLRTAAHLVRIGKP